MTTANVPKEIRNLSRDQLELVAMRAQAFGNALDEARKVIALHEAIYATLVQERNEYLNNLTATQARCTELLEENRRLRAPPIVRVLGDPILPGWTCEKCGVFNGEAKEKRSACRACPSFERGFLSFGGGLLEPCE